MISFGLIVDRESNERANDFLFPSESRTHSVWGPLANFDMQKHDHGERFEVMVITIIDMMEQQERQ